jgi:predicted transposase YbfD/YdcC
VAAYVPEYGVVLAQVQVNGAFDEPTQAPQLLACLDLRGIVVSGDALYAHRDLSLQIVQAHGDYLWVVKANQEGLYDEIQTLFYHLAREEVASETWTALSARYM